MTPMYTLRSDAAMPFQMGYVQPFPPIAGWMTPVELEWLYGQAQNHQNIGEVGSWKGRSTHALLSGCPGMVTAIDHFQGSPGDLHSLQGNAYQEFLRNVGGFPNLHVLNTDSVTAAVMFPDQTFDMVFLDGDHSYRAVMADLEAWLPKLTDGGLLCGHDFDKAGVRNAVALIGGAPSGFGTIWVREAIWCPQ